MIGSFEIFEATFLILAMRKNNHVLHDKPNDVDIIFLTCQLTFLVIR